MTLAQPCCAVVRRGRWAPWRGSPRWRGPIRYPKRRASSGRRLAGCDRRPGLPPCLARPIRGTRITRRFNLRAVPPARRSDDHSAQSESAAAAGDALATLSSAPAEAYSEHVAPVPGRVRSFLLRVQQSVPARGRNKLVGICGRPVSSGYSPSNGRLARAPPLPLTQESLVSILARIIPGVSGRSGQRTALQCPR